jgi:hypothetical protein
VSCPHAAEQAVTARAIIPILRLGSSEELDFIAIVCASYDTSHDVRLCEKAFSPSVTDFVLADHGAVVDVQRVAQQGKQKFYDHGDFWPFPVYQDARFKRALLFHTKLPLIEPG